MAFKNRIAMRVASAVAAVTIAATMSTVCSLGAFAESGASEEVKANKNGVIRIECVYGEDNYPVEICTGFIINNSTVITSKEILGISAEDTLRGQFGNQFQYDKSKLKFRTKISGVYVDASDALGDTTTQFAVLRLNKSIDFEKSDYTDLPLADSTKLETTEKIYSIGYSTETYSKLIINEGNVSSVAANDYVEYTMNNPTEGFIGSPVINEKGGVVALTYSLRTDGYKAIPINSIKNVLNTFSIQYREQQDSPVIEKPIEGSITSQVVPSTKSVTSDGNPEEKASQPQDNSIVSVTSPDDPDVYTSSKPEENTEGNNDMIIWIIIGGIGLIVVILVVVMIVLATRKKPSSTIQPPRPMPQPPTDINRNTQPTGYGGGYSAAPSNMFQNQGSAETTILNEGAGETTILGGSETIGVPSGILVNTKTNDKIIINKAEFSIGKERSRVDYCISNDNSVSRLHLKIRVRDGRCYVVDMGSKNGTYINGNKLTPNYETMIQNGDKLRISTIEFEFKG